MLAQFIINGLIMGVNYSLLAIGFAIVYNTTKIFHIAAAGLYVFAAYMFWLFSVPIGLHSIIAGLVSVILTMSLSLLCEIGVYRPLKHLKATNNVAMIASIGLLAIIINSIAMLFGNNAKVIQTVSSESLTIGEILITSPQLIQVSVGVIIILLILILLKRSGWGLRLRALSDDEILFKVLGYNPDATRTVIFLMSGAIIAISSDLTAYDLGLDPQMGMNFLVSAIVAMIIGGIGKTWTCLIGGLTLGVLQALVSGYFSASWQNAVSFILLLLFLFLKPSGIAGIKTRTV